ncbi:hypothetical protein HK098_006172 [Nowakowskiella sp. JEL0407]|nr:hypothetical protein HK098_006172 [Nowakowskiella sp. JEL0407]
MFVGLLCEGFLMYTVIMALVEAKFTTDNANSLGTTPFLLVYVILFICGLLFYVILIHDGVRNQNSIQIIGATVFNITLTLYTVVQLIQVEKMDLCFRNLTNGPPPTGLIKYHSLEGCPLNASLIMDKKAVQNASKQMENSLIAEFPIILAMIIFCLVGIYISYRTYKDFGWRMFGILGASITKRNMLRYYHIFLVLLKINMYVNAFEKGAITQPYIPTSFNCFAMIVQVLSFIFGFVANHNIAETTTRTRLSPDTDKLLQQFLYITSAIITVTSFLSLFGGWVGLRRGNMVMMIMFMLSVGFNMLAIIGMSVVTWVDPKYLSARMLMTWFACTSAVMNFLLIVFAVLCIKRFKDGLVDLVDKHMKALKHPRNNDIGLDEINEEETLLPSGRSGRSNPRLELDQLYYTHFPIPTGSYTGKTVIITGSNTGLGKETARHYARLGASKLILAVRNLEKGEAAKRDIVDTTQCSVDSIHVWEIDMENYESVKRFAQRVNSELDRVDVFIANAGVYRLTYSVAEDNESTITVNVVSTFLLSFLVLPKLHETANIYDIRPILTIISSEAHGLLIFPEQYIAAPEGKLFEAINDKASFDKYQNQYGMSKLIEIWVVRTISESHPAPNYPITINTVNPGMCHSELNREFGDQWQIYWTFKNLLARSMEMGSRTYFNAASQGPETHGKYLSNCKIIEVSDFARSKTGKRMQERIWKELSDKLEKIQPGIMKNLDYEKKEI